MSIPTDDFPEVPTYLYSDIRPLIQFGDILLCSGTSPFSRLIQATTQSIWSHVAFILRVDAINRLMVLESVESIGVRAVTLSSYVNNYNASGKGYPGKILIARHQQFNPANIVNFSKTAVDLLGYPYNSEEILEIASKMTLKNFGFCRSEKLSKPTRAFICSEYANECFQSVGISIETNPQNYFISPADFARTPEVNAIGYIHIDELLSQ